MFWKLLWSFVNKVYGSCNEASHLQENKKCYNLETTFQEKVNFLTLLLSKLDLSEAINWQLFKSLSLRL